MSPITTLLVAALALTCAQGNIIASKYLAGARNGLREAHGVFRAFSSEKHAVSAQDENSAACQTYISELRTNCSTWHDQLKNGNVDWNAFCTHSCWTSVTAPNNTACLPQDMKNEVTLLTAACRANGPNNTRCGNVLTGVEDTSCSQYNSQSSCVSTSHSAQCEWSGDHCDVALTTAYLDTICSSCIGELLIAVASITNVTGGEDIMGSVGRLSYFQGALCTKVAGAYCAVTVKVALTNLTSGEDLSNAHLTTTCADASATMCLRKLLPVVAGIQTQEVLEHAEYCARPYASQSVTDFRASVTTNCLPCYKAEIADENRLLAFANNLCTKSESGQFCVALANFKPDDAIENCYMTAVTAGTCTSSCDGTFTTFLNTYGCCFGLLAQTVNKTLLVSNDDIARFWGTVNAVRGQGNSLGDSASNAPISSQSRDCSKDDAPQLDKLSVCASLGDIKTRMSTFCAYTRAATKIAKAINLKLNCTAVLATEDIRLQVVTALVRDIAQNLGLPVDAITGVLFQCPTDAPAAHHFVQLVAAPATLQFVIQSDNAAATTAAAAALDAALTSGSMTFPALTATVSSVCTTCASAADLASLATAAALVPTPAPPPPTSAASAVHLQVVIAILLVALTLATPW